MRLIWTKSYLPLSLIIRACTGEDCSHFAFVFESSAKGLMFESNLLGTHPKFLKTEAKTWGFNIVHSTNLDLSTADEDMAWDLIVNKYDGHAYNFGGVFYLGWRCILKRLFGLPLPAKNAWAQPGTYFCDEVYDVLNQIPGVKKVNVMSGMDTPFMVWEKLQGATV